MQPPSSSYGNQDFSNNNPSYARLPHQMSGLSMNAPVSGSFNDATSMKNESSQQPNQQNSGFNAAPNGQMSHQGSPSPQVQSNGQMNYGQHNNQPPMPGSNPNHPHMINQGPPMTGFNPVSGQDQSNISQGSPVHNLNQPPSMSQGLPMPGQNQPPCMSQGPPMPGQNQPQSMGQGPPMPGQNQPQSMGQGPPMPGQNQPQSMGQGPPMPGQNIPTMSTHFQSDPPTSLGGYQNPPGLQNPGIPSQQGMPEMQLFQGPPRPSMGQPNGPPRLQGPPVPGMMGQQGFPQPMQGMPPHPGMQRPQGPPMPNNQFGYNNPQMGQQPGFGAPPMLQAGSMPSPFSGNTDPPMPNMQNGYQQPPGVSQGMAGQQPANWDHLPSVPEVIREDREAQSSVYATGQRGICPPLVTTDFSCLDQGNCNPKFIRSSLYKVPNTSDILNQLGINFTLTSSPFAKTKMTDYPIIISDMGPQGPVRCIRCKAYMNPYNIFIDGGRRFQCALCSAPSEVPENYFAHVDHTGRRTDSMQRPELCLGSYELYATKEYCRRPPKCPAYIFLLDVSQPALKSGFLQMFCNRFVSEILPNLPKPELSPKQKEAWILANPGKEESLPSHIDIPISFITYGNQLNFYSFVTIKNYPNGPDSEPILTTKPQMHIVADTEEMFVPGVEGFFIDSSNVNAIQTLLNIIPNEFIGDTAGPASQVTLLGPAIEAGMEALKASDRPGKLFIFHTCLPTAEAPGRLKNRDDAKIIGTDKEKTLLAPANDFYTKLGVKCVGAGCSVDYFLMPNSYVDIATISEVPKLTGGRIYKYPCFQADRQGDDLVNDLSLALTLPQAFECMMRVRTSTGTRPVDFLGNAHIPNATDIEVSGVDSDWGLTVEIKHDDKLREDEIVVIQLAVLFTSLSGERRLRIHNLTLCTSNKLIDLFPCVDADVHVNYLAKKAIRAVLNKQRTQIFDEMTHDLSSSLATYRKLPANNGTNYASNPGELVLAERLKLLLYFVQSIFKTPIIKSGSACHLHHSDPHAANLLTRQLGSSEIGLDTRSLAMFLINRMDVLHTATYLYPRVYPIHNLPDEEDFTPKMLRCSINNFKSDGAYIVDNGGYNRFLWLGNDLSQEWLLNVFEVNNPRSVPDGAIITLKQNETSRKVCQAFKLIKLGQSRSAKMIIVRQGTEQEAWMKMFLMEDRSADGSPSYGDYVVHVHKEIRTIVK